MMLRYAQVQVAAWRSEKSAGAAQARLSMETLKSNRVGYRDKTAESGKGRGR